MANYYRALGISRNASQDEIREAFLMLSKEYGADEEINEAYQVLSDPVLKAQYDKDWDNAVNKFREQHIKDFKESKRLNILMTCIGAAIIFGFWWYGISTLNTSISNINTDIGQFNAFLPRMEENPNYAEVSAMLSMIHTRLQDSSMISDGKAQYWDMEDTIESCFPIFVRKSIEQGRHQEGLAFIALWKERRAGDSYERATMHFACLKGLKRYEEAEAVVLPYTERANNAEIYQELYNMYEQAGNSEKASYYKQKAGL